MGDDPPAVSVPDNSRTLVSIDTPIHLDPGQRKAGSWQSRFYSSRNLSRMIQSAYEPIAAIPAMLPGHSGGAVIVN